MKLIIELAETEDLEEAVKALEEWYNSPEVHLSAAGQYVLIKTGDIRDIHQFGWRITGLQVARPA